MADLIYYLVGLAVAAYGAWTLRSGMSVVHSVEWLNAYAERKMVPPASRVDFERVAAWVSFTSASTVWMAFGVFLVRDMGVLAACVANLLANYLIGDMSGRPRARAAFYKAWATVLAAAALGASGAAAALGHP